MQYDVPKRVESHTHTIGLIELLGVPDFYIETVIRKGHAEVVVYALVLVQNLLVIT